MRTSMENVFYAGHYESWRARANLEIYIYEIYRAR